MKRTPIPKEIRQQVLERDGYRCRYCGKRSERFHMDHVYPVSKGGETTVDNLVTSCPKCNNKKSNNVGLWPVPLKVVGRQSKHERKLLNYTLWLTAGATFSACVMAVGIETDITLWLVSLGALYVFLLLAIGIKIASKTINESKKDWYD